MNILSLLARLSAADGPAPAAPRRAVLRQLAQAVAAGLPLALTASSAAQARPNDTALDAVTLLLKLEELQRAFYTEALLSPTLGNNVPRSFRADLSQMKGHQEGHIEFLRSIFTNASVPIPPTPSFDFSGRRNNPANPVLFPNVFSDANSFLELAQQLEDAGAAIYKSQAVFAAGNVLFGDALARMHAVEARHAAHVRTLRRANSGARVKSWPSRADAAPAAAIRVPALPATSPATTSSIYAFEATEVQILANSNLVPFATVLTGANVVQTNALAEAFDEPLPTPQATALLNIFG